MKKKIFLSALLLAGGVLANTGYAAVHYTITDLGTLGGTQSIATGINDSGQIVGRASLSGGAGYHAVLWHNGTVTDLGTFGGTLSEAHDINNLGQIVGQANTVGNTSTHAFLYNNGTMTNLGSLGGNWNSAQSINDSGQIVGTSAGRAFLYSGGVMTNLCVQLGTDCSRTSSASAINNNGEIVGSTDDIGGFYFTNGQTIRLGLNPRPYDINELSQTVGVYGDRQAFIYTNGILEDLGNLSLALPFAEALAINDYGQAVGWSRVSPSEWDHAFIFSNGELQDLNILSDAASQGWRLDHATDINNHGQIVGFGIGPGSTSYHAFLLTPVPEPETYAMMLAGLGLVGFMARRKAFAASKHRA